MLTTVHKDATLQSTRQPETKRSETPRRRHSAQHSWTASKLGKQRDTAVQRHIGPTQMAAEPTQQPVSEELSISTSMHAASHCCAKLDVSAVQLTGSAAAASAGLVLQLDAPLSVHLHDDADDDVDDFDDDLPDAQQQQQQQYADEQQHGDEEAGAADEKGSFMRLNLNGQHMEGTIGAPFDEHSGVDDSAGGGSLHGAAGDDAEFPVFKVGECVARSRQPMSCVRCDVSAGHVYIGSYTGELVLFDFAAAREVWRRQVAVEGKPVAITCLDINSQTRTSESTLRAAAATSSTPSSH